jgi:hypothetical protein
LAGPSGVYWTNSPDGVPRTTCLPLADQLAEWHQQVRVDEG